LGAITRTWSGIVSLCFIFSCSHFSLSNDFSLLNFANVYLFPVKIIVPFSNVGFFVSILVLNKIRMLSLSTLPSITLLMYLRSIENDKSSYELKFQIVRILLACTTVICQSHIWLLLRKETKFFVFLHFSAKRYQNSVIVSLSIVCLSTNKRVSILQKCTVTNSVVEFGGGS
jgi:hypothetical protein